MLQKYPMYAYIPAQDVARERAFYEQKVGLKPTREEAGGVTYESAEIASIEGMGRAAWFKDSEGNIMAIIQMTG